ncbi:MAG: hypothetical protein ABI432_03945 [Flavobacteriales bacterium]
MREEHPIDQYFRDALSRAEVQPPPSVWEGVKNGRRRRRGLAFWSRRRGLTIATLMVALGAGAYWATRQDRTPIQPSIISTVPSGPTHKVVPTPAPTNAPLDAAKATEGRTANSKAAFDSPHQRAPIKTKKASEMPVPERAVEQTGLAIHSQAPWIATTPASPATPGAIDVPLPQLQEGTNVPGTSALFMDVGTIGRMDPLRSAWHGSALPLSPEGSNRPTTYVLPSSEWWVALQMGWYDVRRQWTGDNTELTDALNASETWTSTIGVGALVGRTWRSGWGFSTGAEHERSEQQFHYVDQWTYVEQEVTTSLVTLNTQVFISQSDTVTTQVVDERIAEGLDKRSVIRVPVEGHWRGAWRRWTYGLSAGLAGEFTSVTSNAILVQDAQDGHISTAAPEGDELRERYPIVVLGTLSADLGYSLSERWTLWASPAYMNSLGALGTRSDVFAQPERFGLRLRLGYTFNCHRDR